MDQSKWSVLKQRVAQSSKEAEGFVRARLNFHAVGFDGISLNAYLAHPGCRADSSLIVETLCRVLESEASFRKRPRSSASAHLWFEHWMDDRFSSNSYLAKKE